jgi:prepilin-type N-terminal cleavage/methylation domain-containing protein
MKKQLSETKGFTLSEILVSIQIFSLIMLFLYAGFRVFQGVYIRRLKSFQEIQKTAVESYTKHRKENEKLLINVFK